MGQTFGILGFFFALLAIFFASEVMRRASQRQAELEIILFKTQTRIQKLEASMLRIERLSEKLRHQKNRQSETLTALAKREERDERQQDPDHDAFIPSAYKVRKSV